MLVLHKLLLSDIPGSRYRRESSPTIVLAEYRRAITTNGCLKHISAIKRVIHTTIERDVTHFLQIAALNGVLNAQDGLCVRHIIPSKIIIIVTFNTETESIVILLLFPGITTHQAPLTLSYLEIVVKISLKSLFTTKISITGSLTILVANTLQLRVTGIIGTISTLIITPRIVDTPNESLPKFEGGLTNKLVTFPDCLRLIFLHQCKRVIVLGARAYGPCSIRIFDSISRRIIVHGIKHRCTLIARWYAKVFAIHHIRTNRNRKVVFQCLG